MASPRGIVVFSGGSAANNLVDVFNSVRESKNCRLSYIIPISDNGGSSSELIRVFGGPGIGDVRSRLVRLIPSRPVSTERIAIANLFNHRLSSTDPQAAAGEWQTIVAGTSHLWSSIPSSKKQLIHSFLNLLNLEILKRSRPPTSTFDFTSASVGNLFLTGARLFSGSFESAIYLLGSITGVPDDHIQVIPAINSNFTHHIAAQLADGSTIVGQNSISHPSVPTALENPSSPEGEALQQEPSLRTTSDPYPYSFTTEEDANLPGSLPTLRLSSIKFSKSPSPSHSSSNPTQAPSDDLPSRISRLYYINPYGLEMPPPSPNPRLLESLHSAQAIIYSIGSLYTSLIPSLILRGIGTAIRNSQGAARTKILILNGSLDREVGPSHEPLSALEFVAAIVRAGEQGSSQSIQSAPAPSTSSPTTQPDPDPNPNPNTNPNPALYKSYITHLIHLSGPGTPTVDRTALKGLGIETVKLYGRPMHEKNAEGVLVPKGMKYDPQALTGALQTILGRKGAAMVDDGSSEEGEGERQGGGGGGLWQPAGRGGMAGKSRSRRNTLEG